MSLTSTASATNVARAPASTLFSAEPEIAVLPHYFVPSWPPKPGKQPVQHGSMTLPAALTCTFETDAMFTVYRASWKQGYRLNIEAFGHGEIFVDWFVIDADGPGHVSTPEWQDAEWEKVDALFARHGEGYFYQTQHGYRIIFRHAPFQISSLSDKDAWAQRYLAYASYLRTDFGIVCDESLASWDHVVRLPGAPKIRKSDAAGITYGDPAKIAVWTYEPLASALLPTTKPRRTYEGDGESNGLAFWERAGEPDLVAWLAFKATRTPPNGKRYDFARSFVACVNDALDDLDEACGLFGYDEEDDAQKCATGVASTHVCRPKRIEEKWPGAIEGLRLLGVVPAGTALLETIADYVRACGWEYRAKAAANDWIASSPSILADIEADKESRAEREGYVKNGQGIWEPKPKPSITLGVEIHAVVEQAKTALARDSQIFHRHGRLVQFNTVSGVPKIREIKQATLKSELSRVAQWQTNKKGEPNPVRCCPSPDVVAAVAEVEQWPAEMHALTKVVETPTLRADGSVLQEEGYDAATGFWFAPGNAVFPEIPEAPTQEDARRAFAELYEPFAEFATSEPEKCVGIAAVLTSLAMGALEGENYPAFVFEANVQGAGKGLSCNVVSLITTGRVTPPQTFPSSDKTELEKILSGVARDGYPLVCFDNISSEFGGDALEGRMTCGGVSQSRILGKSETVRLPWRTIVLATGNNVALTRDMCRRVLRCRIVRLEENPQLKTEWKIADLEGWVKTNRPRLVAAGLTLLRAYFLAGCPGGDLVWGSFNAWSRLVAGAIRWASGVNVLDTRILTSEAFDENMATLSTLLATWPEELLGEEFSLGALDTDVVMPEEAPHPTLKTVIDDICDGKERKRKVGMWLKRRHQQVIGGRQLLVSRDKKTNTNVYTVLLVNSQ